MLGVTTLFILKKVDKQGIRANNKYDSHLSLCLWLSPPSLAVSAALAVMAGKVSPLRVSPSIDCLLLPSVDSLSAPVSPSRSVCCL